MKYSRKLRDIAPLLVDSAEIEDRHKEKRNKNTTYKVRSKIKKNKTPKGAK